MVFLPYTCHDRNNYTQIATRREKHRFPLARNDRKKRVPLRSPADEIPAREFGVGGDLIALPGVVTT